MVAKEFREKSLKLGLTIPEWQSKVRANILKFSTSLELRQAEAGNQQYIQGAVMKLPMSVVLGHLLDEIRAGRERKPVGQVSTAVQKAGADRKPANVCYLTRCMILSHLLL